MASLIITEGDQAGRFHPMATGPVVIGREEGAAIQILDDLVSRQHARIEFDTEFERWMIDDLGSRNGVELNGTRINMRTVLRDGDEVRIGASLLVFSLEDFGDLQAALQYCRTLGERDRSTMIDGSRRSS